MFTMLFLCYFLAFLSTPGTGVYASKKWTPALPRVPSQGTWLVSLENSSVDGYERPVVLVNGLFKPLIEFVQGELVEITVVNNIPADYPSVSDGLTIHWHGLNMRSKGIESTSVHHEKWLALTPYSEFYFLADSSSWFDGTAYVSQCPIYSGKGFTYRFIVDEMPGTYFWHAHAGTLKADGLSGPLIIRPAKGSREPINLKYNAERILTISDWYHTQNGALAMPLNRPFADEAITNDTGGFAWVGNPQSILFNGKGCYEDCTVGTNTTTCEVTAVKMPSSNGGSGCSHEQISVMPNKQYLLRIVNDASLVMMTVCIEDHPMTLVAADAVPIEPITVDCVDINSGQRYDALITTNQPPGQYWMTALPQYRAKSPNGYAVLRYTGTPAQLPPTPVLQPGSVPPWSLKDYKKIAMRQDLLDAKVPAGSTHSTGAMQVPDPTVRIYVNISQPLIEQTGQIRWALNNIAGLNTPPCQSLQDIIQKDPSWIGDHSMVKTAANSTNSAALGVETGTGKDPGAVQVWVTRPNQPDTEAAPVVGTHVVNIALGEIVEIVLQNNPASSFNGDYTKQNPRSAMEQHPFHLHGQHFWDLGIVNGTYPGPKAAASQLNTANPPFRDTATILPGSYLVLRFKAENPGTWMMHCHILWHQFMGQLMTFVVSPDKLAPPPEGMPKCNQECTYNAAPWTVSYVNETYGNSGYDLPSP